MTQGDTGGAGPLAEALRSPVLGMDAESLTFGVESVEKIAALKTVNQGWETPMASISET